MQKTKLPSLITILILTLITALMWIGFTIFRAFTASPTPSVPQEISNPLTPTLDTNTITKVESALFFSEAQVPPLNVTVVATPTPKALPKVAASPTPTALPTGSPEAIPTESPLPTATP